jgi:hypothetical protein
MPPSDSAACASAVALCRRVPLVSSPAVSDAKPARAGGSTSAPASTTNCAVTSCTPRRSARTTRSPFGRRCSIGAAIASARGVAGAGGLSKP